MPASRSEPTRRKNIFFIEPCPKHKNSCHLEVAIKVPSHSERRSANPLPGNPDLKLRRGQLKPSPSFKTQFQGRLLQDTVPKRTQQHRVEITSLRLQ